jgi:hypothetical protein
MGGETLACRDTFWKGALSPKARSITWSHTSRLSDRPSQSILF